MEGPHQFPWHRGMPEQLALRGRGRHERRDAAEHRQRILEVASRLFAEYGVESVSMHQIAMTAGIGQGTLYRRYAHKGALCVDLMHERREQFMEEIATLFKKNATALERLDSVLAHCIALLEEQWAMLGPIVTANMRDAMCDGPDHSHRVPVQREPFYLWLYELFTGLLTEAVAKGELAPLDISFTTDAILATFHPMFYRFQRQERGFTPERILQGLRHIYIDGLKTPRTYGLLSGETYNAN